MIKKIALFVLCAACTTTGGSYNILSGSKPTTAQEKSSCVSTYALAFSTSCENSFDCIKTKITNNYTTIAKKCNLETVTELNSMWDEIKLMQSMS